MPHKAFTAYSWILIKKVLRKGITHFSSSGRNRIIFGIFMFLNSYIFAQNSIGITGAASNLSNSRFKLRGLENNVASFPGIKDWEFSAAYSTEFGTQTTSNLYLISLSKRINQHFFYLRYTPGYEKDFLLRTGVSVISYDSVPVNLQSKIQYQEKFGFGYSFRLSNKFSAGLGMRFYREEFTDDQVVPVYSDTLTTITTSTSSRIYNRWRGDLGLNYMPSDKLVISLSSVNLLADNIANTNNDLLLKNEKSAIAGIDYQISRAFNCKAAYQSNNSFSAGLNFAFPVLNNNLSFSAEVFHDKYQDPFLAGFIPAINYSSKYFSITLSGIKYFKSRKDDYPAKEFYSTGIYNLTNNQFSADRAALSVNFALNTINERVVKFEDVKITQNIFPVLNENYLNSPFATAKVINLSEKTIRVLPSSKIAGINPEKIQSPSVLVNPLDTCDVNFYTLIDESGTKNRHTQIAQADFYLSVDAGEIEDQIQKPILIHDANSWDGNINNLRYFVKQDFDFSSKHAKACLTAYKNTFDTLAPELNDFYTTRILFSDFISSMVYIADPRSSSDRVQYPGETFAVKGGDCEDLAVAFSSLLESVGIQTAFVDYRSDRAMNHVNLLVNLKLPPELAQRITINDKKYFLRKNSLGRDEVWIPLETTNLKSFSEAWESGSDLFYDEAIDKYGLSKGNVQIVDIY